MQELWLYTNELTTVPPEMGNLRALKRLWLEHNRITTLPKELINMGNLQVGTAQKAHSPERAALKCNKQTRGPQVGWADRECGGVGHVPKLGSARARMPF